MSGRLGGKIAVVTGGASGIGQATAVKLAREGADVAVGDINSTDETKTLVEATGRRFFGAKCDFSDEVQVKDFAAHVGKALGPVDILVNNAAVVMIGEFEEITFAQWKKIFSVNLDGYFLAAKAFVGDLKRSQAGRVINVSSTIHLEGTQEKMIPYITSKVAINGFTGSLAADMAKHNITVNAVAPSVVRTPFTEAHLPDAFFEAHIQLQNLKRQQEPADLANTIAFLASDEASFITGQFIAVDGGLSRR